MIARPKEYSRRRPSDVKSWPAFPLKKKSRSLFGFKRLRPEFGEVRDLRSGSSISRLNLSMSSAGRKEGTLTDVHVPIVNHPHPILSCHGRWVRTKSARPLGRRWAGRNSFPFISVERVVGRLRLASAELGRIAAGLDLDFIDKFERNISCALLAGWKIFIRNSF